MDEWRRTTLADLCNAGACELQTGPFGSQLHAHDYLPNGVAVVPTEAIRARRIDHAVLPRISREKAGTLERHRLEPGDILFARRGVQATGHIAVVRDAEAGFICGTGAIRLRVTSRTEEIDSEFLSHVLADPASIEWFKFHAIGATMPNLNEGIIRAFSFLVPPCAEQRSIAQLLSALDDKIELNRRMNETLEALARALFKDWFVDFGPTRAKQEGREPYLAPELWSLFPERLDAEGKPEGWKNGTLADVADMNSESWSAGSNPDYIEYVDLANTKWGTIEATEEYVWKDAPSRARRVLRLGDTIVGTVRPGNGSYAYIGRDGLTGSTGFAVLRPKQLSYRELVYCAATAPENIERLSHRADGAAYPAVRPDVVGSTEFVRSGASVIQAFSDTCAPVIDRIETNKKEARTLAQLRDLLLPKLMSGEIRVKDAVGRSG